MKLEFTSINKVWSKIGRLRLETILIKIKFRRVQLEYEKESPYDTVQLKIIVLSLLKFLSIIISTINIK